MCRSGDCIVRLVVSSLETSKYKRQVENLHKISEHISLGRFHLNISSTIDAILRPPNFQSVNQPSVLIGRSVKSREKTLYEHLAACLLFRTPKIPCAMFIFFCMTHVLFPLLFLFLLFLFLSSPSVSLGSLCFPFFHHFSVTLADLQQLHHAVRLLIDRFCLGGVQISLPSLSFLSGLNPPRATTLGPETAGLLQNASCDSSCIMSHGRRRLFYCCRLLS